MDESKVVVIDKPKDAPTPEQEKAAQEFADKMVQNIIKQLPPKPTVVGSDNTEVLKVLEIIRHNQYLDHMILEKIWDELRCTEAQARIIDQLAEQETARRKKG